MHADAATKQRTYRARLAAEIVLANRRRWTVLEAYVEHLGEAVEQARGAAYPEAR